MAPCWIVKCRWLVMRFLLVFIFVVTSTQVAAKNLPPSVANQIDALIVTARGEADREFGADRKFTRGNPELVSSQQKTGANVSLIEGDIAGAVALPAGVTNDVVADKTLLWPNGRIPYKIDDRFSLAQKRLIEFAFRAFEQESCIRFVNKTEQDENFLYVRRVTIGCNSDVGYSATPRQLVNFAADCFDQFGRLLHELMHVIGFFHEQSRSDRDDWVKIVWNKIPSGWRFNFDKLSSSEIDEQGQPYDYGSLMHYPPDAFGEPAGTVTIIPKQALDDAIKMGQRRYFSDLDIKKMNILYKCSKVLATRFTCKPDEIQCKIGTDFIHMGCAKRCDGIAQCRDGADEKACPAPTCAEGDDFWPCKTIKCIPKSWICDGARDCVDGEDERPENCQHRKCKPSTELDCGKCVPAFRICDGKRDCPAGQDETQQMCALKKTKPVPQNLAIPPPPPRPLPVQKFPQIFQKFPTRWNEPKQNLFFQQNQFFSQPAKTFPQTPPHRVMSPAFWQYAFGSQPFGTPLAQFFSPSYAAIAGGRFAFDAPSSSSAPTIQRHCFFNLQALQDRPEIKLSSKNIDDIVNNLSQPPCSVIEIGFPKIDSGSLTVDFLEETEQQEVLKVLQKAAEFQGFVVVVGSNSVASTSPNIEAVRIIGNNVTKAEIFALNIVKKLRSWNATGLVVQWLKPDERDKSALNTLVKSLANAIQYDDALLKKEAETKRLVFGITLTAHIQPGHDEQIILANVDYLNIMPYDSTHTSKTTFYSNKLLTQLTSDDDSQWHGTWLFDKTLRKRINIGIQLAPNTWTIVQPSTKTVGAVIRALGKPGPFTGTAGKLNAGEICILINNTPQKRFVNKPSIYQNATSGDNAYAFSTADQWISYETQTTLISKLRKAANRLKQFNGIFIADAENDDMRGVCGTDEQYALLKVTGEFIDEI